MNRRFSIAWWPVLAAASSFLIPWLWWKNRGFRREQALAAQQNQARLARAQLLNLPELERVEFTPLSEWARLDGFLGEPGVSYLLKSERGELVYDLGFGDQNGVFQHNSRQLGLAWRQAPLVVISHLHPDHMGGERAYRKKTVIFPQALGDTKDVECYLPAPAQEAGPRFTVAQGPMVLPGGIGTTGPLARRLFLMGWCEEQALLFRIKNKGLVVVTACTHPGIETVLTMASRLCSDPVHAIVGGMHFPLTESRLKKPGLQTIMVFGTGKPPWRRITDQDLDLAIAAINRAAPAKVFLSAHDTCDYALQRMSRELKAETEVLKAGASYRF
ncbi:metal-dependent hydrolase [Desulfocarbo indianensis]|nr:metal-dependent hydrolase [Desulfocarbo indianensis]